MEPILYSLVVLMGTTELYSISSEGALLPSEIRYFPRFSALQQYGGPPQYGGPVIILLYKSCHNTLILS